MASASDKDQYDDLSDDTFDDTDTFGDQGTDDDVWDDADATDKATPAKAKKSGNTGNLVIIGIGVLLVFGFIYFKVASVPASKTAAPAPVEQTAAVDPAPTAPAPVDPAAMPPITAPAAPSMGDVVITPSTPETATPGPTNDPMMPMPDDQTAGLPAPTMQPADNLPQPTNTGIPMVAGAQTMPDVAPTPVTATPLVQADAQMAPQTTAASGMDDTRLVALEKKLNEIEQKVAAPTSTTDDLKKIITQLDALSSRLDDLEQRSLAAQKVAAQREAAPVEQPLSRPRAEETAPTPQPVRTYQPAPARTVSTPSPRYVFKAVAGGKAYVAKAGSSSIVAVSVGDTLEGLGTVQSIGQVNGKWVVRATGGRISQ